MLNRQLSGGSQELQEELELYEGIRVSVGLSLQDFKLGSSVTGFVYRKVQCSNGVGRGFPVETECSDAL